MALDAKRSVYEIAVNVGGEMKQSMRTTARTTNQHLKSIEAQATRSASAMSRFGQSGSNLKIISGHASASASAMYSMGNAASGLIKLLRTGAIAGITMKVASGIKSVAASAISAAAEMETYRTTLNTVLKDEAKAGEMMQWATNFAAHTPYNTSDVVEAVVKMQAYGMNAQTMLENIGNMASAANKDLVTAVEAVYKASIGEMELMRNNFAINKDMINAKAQEVYGQSVVNASGAITNAEIYNNAMLRLIEENFAGGMEKQSKTWEGIKSNIEDSWQMALRKLAGMDEESNIIEGGLFDRIKTELSSVGSWMEEFAASDTMERWGKNATAWLDSVITKVKSLGISFEETGTGIVENTASIVKSTGDILNTLKIPEILTDALELGSILFGGLAKLLDFETWQKEGFTGYLKNLAGEGEKLDELNARIGTSILQSTWLGRTLLEKGIISKPMTQAEQREAEAQKQREFAAQQALTAQQPISMFKTEQSPGTSNYSINITLPQYGTSTDEVANKIADIVAERIELEEKMKEANRQQRRVSLTSRATAEAY